MFRNRKGDQMSVSMNRDPRAAGARMSATTTGSGRATTLAPGAVAASGRRIGLLGAAAAVSLMMLSGCSTVDDTWDSVFGSDAPPAQNAPDDASSKSDTPPDGKGTDEPASAPATASKDAEWANDAQKAEVEAAAEPEGLNGAANRPAYAKSVTRRAPSTRYALDETPKAAEPTRTEAPKATAVESTPVAPPASQPSVMPQTQASQQVASAQKAPIPSAAATAVDQGETVVIGGDGSVEVDPSVQVNYQAVPGASAHLGNSKGPLPLNMFDPAATSVSTLVATIQFAVGSSSLDGKDRQVLRKVVALQKRYGGSLRVVGHASSHTADMSWSRHDAANEKVSEDRARSVSRALMDMGVSGRSIYVGAVSDSQPLYEEVMPSGEAGNRRAEIYLDY